MSAETTTPELHMTAEQVANMARAYGISTTAYVRQVLALNDALSYGLDVKTVAADMMDAHRADASVPKLVASTLGYRKAAITAAEIIGTDIRALAKRSPETVRSFVSAADRHGVKVFTTAIRDALKPIAAEKHADREEIARTVTADLLDAPVAAKKSTPRKAASEKDGPDADPAAGTGATRESVDADMSARTALAAIRAVTQWLETGAGSWSPDLASALSSLTDAASSARKRGQAGTRTLKGATAETVAA